MAKGFRKEVLESRKCQSWDEFFGQVLDTREKLRPSDDGVDKDMMNGYNEWCTTIMSCVSKR